MVRPGVTAVFGQTNTGKTTLTAELLLRSGRRVLWFDLQAAESLDRFPALRTLAQVRDFLMRPPAGAWIRTVRGDPELYEALAPAIRHLRGVVLVLDDAGPLLNDSPVLQAAAWKAAVAGRHHGRPVDRAVVADWGVELFVIAHRPVDVPAKVRGQVQRIVSFHQGEQLDLDYLRGRCGEAFAEQVRALEGRQHAAWPSMEAVIR